MYHDDERRLIGEYLDEVVTGLERMVASLERVAAVVGIDDKPAPPAGSGKKWQEFLEQHPELQTIEFTDDEVYDALEWAARPDTEVTNLHGVTFPANFRTSAGLVLQVLEVRKGCSTGYSSQRSGRSALMRVVAALKRLEIAGRVRQEVRVIYGKRESSNWHPVRNDA